VSVQAGGDANITLVTGVAVGTLRGTVYNNSGILTEAVIQAWSGGLLQASAVTDHAGNYVLSLPQGNYEIRGLAPGHVATTVATSAAIAANTTTTIHVSLAKLGVVFGTVRDGAGLPIAGADVTVTGALHAGAVTDVNGHYTTIGLPAGTYSFTVQAAQGTYTGSTTVANNVTAAGDAVLGTGASPTNAAVFIKTDNTTKGNWKGVYGADGFSMVNHTAQVPAYARAAVNAPYTWTWAATTFDARALLQQNSTTDRIAACWYEGSGSFDIDLEFNDGKAHQVALYMLDWDSGGRRQKVDVYDGVSGALLDSRAVGDLYGGEYLVWNLQGKIRIRVVRTAGWNAVLSGVFFGGASTVTPAPPPPPPPSSANGAAFVKTDNTTKGNWKGVYGAGGFSLVKHATQWPSYAAVTVNAPYQWAWTESTNDSRALLKQTAGTADRMAACWYEASGSFEANIQITDGRTHQIALYMLDWDSGNRRQKVEVYDADTGTLLDSRGVGDLYGGEYLVWNVQGKVRMKVVRTAGWNAVLSGIFID
jgi:hypothetical protein